MIAYLIKSTVCLLLLYAVYRLFLEQEKMHEFNRWFLICSLIFSLTIPLLTIHIGTAPVSDLQLSNRLEALTSSPKPSYNEQFKNQLLTREPSTATTSKSTSPLFYRLFLWVIYIVITAALLIRFFYNLFDFYKKISQNECRPYRGTTLVLCPRAGSPHSFFNFIFIDKARYASGILDEAVLTHERAHGRQKHSLDILFIEVLKIVFWFNPVFYVYKKVIRLNHEFLADDSVTNITEDFSAYQKLLLKLQSNEKGIHLASSIGYSVTKKRIVMMKKKTPRIQKIIKQAAIIPVIAALAFVFINRKARAQDVKSMSLGELNQVVTSKIKSNTSLASNESGELQKLQNKIQQQLNEAAASSVDTSKPGKAYAQATKKFIRQKKKYERIKPVPANKEKLTRSYKKVKALHDKVHRLLKKIDIQNFPPPPPFPFSPTKRIEAHAKKLSQKKPPLPPPPPPEPKDPAVALKQYSKSYSTLFKAYFEIPATSANKDKLQSAYKKVMTVYDKLDSLKKIVRGKNLPPTPKPPKPMERIETKFNRHKPDTSKIERMYSRRAKKYEKQASKYAKIKAVPANRQRLERAYKKTHERLTQALKAYRKAKKKNKNVKPLPPLPPKKKIQPQTKDSAPSRTTQKDSLRYVQVEKKYQHSVNTYKSVDITNISTSHYKKLYKNLSSLGSETYDLYDRIKRKYDIPKPPLPPSDKITERFYVLRRKYYAVKPVPENKDQMRKTRRRMKAFVKKWKPVKAEFDHNANYSIPRGPAERIKIYKRAQAKAKVDTSQLSHAEKNYRRLSKKYGKLIQQYKQITPSTQNEARLKRSYKKQIALHKKILKIYKKVHGKPMYEELVAPLIMKPTSRIMVYYRQHPKLAVNNSRILKMAANDFRRGIKKYNNMAPTNKNKQTLGIYYAQMVTFRKNWENIFKVSNTNLSLEPLPKAAWKRIKERNKN